MSLIRDYVRKVFEFADSRKDAINDLKGLSTAYTEHICKLVLWGSQRQEWVNDWSNEVYEYLNNIAGLYLKGNKRLKEKDYCEFFFFKYLEEWEFPKRLNRCARYFRDKDYPQPNYVNTDLAYRNYIEFVNRAIVLVLNDNVGMTDILNLCSEFLVQKS